MRGGAENRTHLDGVRPASVQSGKIAGFLDQIRSRPGGDGPRRLSSPGEETLAASLRAFHRFDPQPYDGDVVLLRCTDLDLGLLSKLKDLPAQDHGWSSVVRGTLRIRDIACRHDCLTRAPNLSRVVELTREVLGGEASRQWARRAHRPGRHLTD